MALWAWVGNSCCNLWDVRWERGLWLAGGPDSDAYRWETDTDLAGDSGNDSDARAKSTPFPI